MPIPNTASIKAAHSALLFFFTALISSGVAATDPKRPENSGQQGDLFALQAATEDVRKSEFTESSAKSLLELTSFYTSLDLKKESTPLSLIIAQHRLLTIVVQKAKQVSDWRLNIGLISVLENYIATLKSQVIPDYKPVAFENKPIPDLSKWPKGQFFAAGMAPESIRDPIAKALYEEEISKNLTLKNQNTYQARLVEIIASVEKMAIQLREIPKMEIP